MTVFRAEVADGQPDRQRSAAQRQDPPGAPPPARWARLRRPLTPAADAVPGRLAGRVLALASLVPALLAVSWVVAAFPLAAVGQFRPVTVVPLAVIVAALLVPAGLSLVRRAEVAVAAPWWSVAATGTIAAGFGVFAALSHSEHVIPRRDAGSYIEIAYWLAHHGNLTLRIPFAAFGSSPPLIAYGSPAFYQHGDLLVPQFMTGWPSLLAGADWVGGWAGMLLLPALVGACAILAVGGLAARLLGARWAPLAALLTACAWPVLRVAQETLSEPLALLTLAAGASLLVDLVVVGRVVTGTEPTGDGQVPHGRIHRHAFAAGLLLAAGELVRLDFGVDFAFVLPVLGWLWLTRRPGVLAFAAGAVLGGALSALDGAYVTRPYISANGASVKLLIELLAAVTVATVVAVFALRWAGRSARDLRWWGPVPRLGAAAVLLIAAGLLVRPYVLVDHSTTDPLVLTYTGQMQAESGLPVDGSRGYAEQSLWWVSWYLGWPLLAAGLVGATGLARRVLAGRDLRWAPVLLVFLGSSVATLLRPGITPDHPWADRRLVVEVIPGMILFATWTAAAAVGRVRARSGVVLALLDHDGSRAGRLRAAGSGALLTAAALAAVAALLVPAVAATAPVAALRTEQGELAAAADVCATLAPNDSVVLIDPLWMPTIREQCGLPVAQVIEPSPITVAKAAVSIRAAGRVPVVAGSQLDSPAPLGLTANATVHLVSAQDQQRLERRPDGTELLYLEFWLVRL